ncbi:MAG: sensor histidine kinase, partial [Planctomycetota bacterium]
MTKQAVRIVTIDDDPDDQEILRRILEDIPEWQVDYRAFLDPHEAIAALREEDADLIFLDYRLGEWTGLAVLQNLRATGIHSPVIFLTGQGDEQVAVEAMHAGAADYMVKHALSINSLRRASATALKRAELERSLREHRENLERTNADLAQRNEAMRSFHHVLSHELRNPAGAALASAQMLLDDPNAGTTAEQREFLEIIESSCQQLLVQIQDLLDLSRMETGKLSVRPQQADLGRVVRQAVVAMGGRAAEQGITLSCSVAEELPSVNVDRDRIAQVINNLLGNALKFTPAGGSVQVRVTCAATEN